MSSRNFEKKSTDRFFARSNPGSKEGSSPSRSSRLATVLSFLMVFSTACQFGPGNGQVFSGNTLGKSVTFFGTTIDPGHTISIEVLDPADQDPYDAASIWTEIATTTPNASPANWNGDDLYTWSASAVIVNNAGQQDRWRNGGLVRTRAKINFGGGSTTAQVFENFLPCAFDNTTVNSMDFSAICGSTDSPVATLVNSDPVPSPTSDFLSRKQTATLPEAEDYLAAVGSGPGGNRESFAQWKSINGFPSADEFSAVYFNAGDLGSGREMHCREISAREAGLCGFKPFPFVKYPGGRITVRTACYVSNYFDTVNLPSNDPATSVDMAVAGHLSGIGLGAKATVAMEREHFYNEGAFPANWCQFPTSPASVTNRVKFYVYGPDETDPALPKVALDDQGEKLVPGLCLSCHGGNPDFADPTNIEDAEFLPFDVESFSYSTIPGYSLTDQQESFRELNAMVRQAAVKFPSPIVELIDGWYPSATPGDGVLTPGSTADTDFVPAGFAGGKRLYNGVIKPYCRMCHISQSGSYAFNNIGTFPSGSANSAACGYQQMPHAQVTQAAFWNSPARMILQNETGNFNHCASTP
jgi:hypothetical protein